MEVIVKEYITPDGKSPFGRWFDGLNAIAAAKIRVAIARIELGNFSNSKSVGSHVWEIKIDFGPGYRVYYGFDGEEVIILLAGGTKKDSNKIFKKLNIFGLNIKKEWVVIRYGFNKKI
ncbi:MAG: type II toxin-antitoxin system RelE/ParE family toxin [Candidatus Berkiella sp.]